MRSLLPAHAVAERVRGARAARISPRTRALQERNRCSSTRRRRPRERALLHLRDRGGRTSKRAFVCRDTRPAVEPAAPPPGGAPGGPPPPLRRAHARRCAADRRNSPRRQPLSSRPLRAATSRSACRRRRRRPRRRRGIRDDRPRRAPSRTRGPRREISNAKSARFDCPSHPPQGTLALRGRRTSPTGAAQVASRARAAPRRTRPQGLCFGCEDAQGTESRRGSSEIGSTMVRCARAPRASLNSIVN